MTLTSSAVAALWRREILKFLRDRSRLLGALAQPLGFWLLLGLGFQGSFRMPTEAAADVGYMEFLFPGIVVLILLFTAIFSTISVVEERTSGFLQAALVAPASRGELVLGSALGGTTLAVAEAVLFLLLLPLLGLVPHVVGILVMLVVAALIAFAFTALGLTIAWRMSSTRGFHAVMNLFLLPMWFLSGAFFPAEGAPAVLRAVIAINPVSYGVAAVRQALYWPAEAPIEIAPIWVCLLVCLAFAAAVFGLAVYTARRAGYEA